MNWIQPFSLLQALIGIYQVANLLGFPNKEPLNFRNSDFSRIDKAMNRFPFHTSSLPFMSFGSRRSRDSIFLDSVSCFK